MTHGSFTLNAPPGNALPMHYSRIEPLSGDAHRGLKVRAPSDFRFARKFHRVPLAAAEFTMAARHYPILLLGDALEPFAALGVKPEQNLFVSDNGSWDPGVYVPAYVRRYPFMLLRASEDGRLTLGVDVPSATTTGARPLYTADGRETDATIQALDLCNQYYGAALHTQNFAAALKSADIAVDFTLEAEPAPGQRLNLGTFKRIHEQRLQALPDSTILDWRKSGFLHAVYYMLQSMNNWEMLLYKAGIRASA